MSLISRLYSDEHWMQQALNEARLAGEADEVPVGAVIVCNNRIIGRGHNQTERLTDVTAHAEMIALTAAGIQMGAKFLPDCSMYVSLEPCPMCAAALRWARIGRLVFGAADLKMGYRLFEPCLLHPKTEVFAGLLGEESGKMVSDFFRRKRKVQ
jgi:tRNA(adenine34) deaminase